MNTAGLSGIVISGSTNVALPQQYDLFYEALKTYTGTLPKGGPDAKTALLEMRELEKSKDFDAPKPDRSEWMKKDEKGNIVRDANGNEVEDDIIKDALWGGWKSTAAASEKPFQHYKETMKALFNVVIGQCDSEIVNSLKGDEDWAIMDARNSTIMLMKKLKNLCYRDDINKLDTVIDIIRKIKRAIHPDPKDMDKNKAASDHVDDIRTNIDVLKACDITISSPILIKYALTHVLNDKHTYAEYCEAWSAKDDAKKKIKTTVDQAIRELITSRVAIESSPDGMYHAIRTKLEYDYVRDSHKGRDDTYPNTVAATTALLSKYRIKRGKPRIDKDQKEDKENGAKKNDRDDDATPGDTTEEAHVSMNIVSEQIGNVSLDVAHQLLLQGLDMDDDSDDDEDNDTAHSFLQFTNDHDTSTFTPYDHPLLKQMKNTTTMKDKGIHNTNDEYICDEYIFAQPSGRKLDPFWLLLDSQASINIISNPAMVTNIRTHPDGRVITVNCNAGSIQVDTIADMPGYGTVWFHPNGIANCLSLALVSDKFRVTLDTGMDQAFYVHTDDGSQRFSRVTENLYVHDMNDKEMVVLVTTVDGKKLNYSNLDVRRATAARRLQEIMQYPSVDALLTMIDNNAIKNCTVTRRDIKMADDIFGVNPNEVKGKMVWRQPKHVREDILPVPPAILDKYPEIALSIDVYYINGCAFLRTISRHLLFRSTMAIRNAKSATLFKTIKTIMNEYKVRGFAVTQIHGDNQFTFLTDMLNGEEVTFYPVAANSHEPFIERDNRTSKERCRCTMAGLPYSKLPKRMILELPKANDFWLNYWCSSGGVSDTVPPRQILTGIQLDANKHCRFQFGDYVLSYSGTDNTMKERANDSIYLRPTGTPDGAFYAMNLDTGERIRRLRGVQAHITNTIIKRVEQLATQQGMPEGLVMRDRNMEVIARITIRDLETESIVSMDDDSNASDDSYSDNEDEMSVDSELSGVITENDDDGNDEINHENEMNNPEVIQPEETQEWEDHMTADGGNNQNNDTEDIDNVDIENEETNEVHDETQPEANNPENTDDGTTENASAEPARLRSAVNRINAKTFEHTVHQRHALFAHGYSEAVKKLERDNEMYCMIQHAVETYNNMDASLITPQYGVERGLKIFKELGTKAVMKELDQMHRMKVVSPMHIKDLSEQDIKNALPYLMFLKRKRCGKVKGRGCADGRAQREFISKDESSSPTASLYAIILTAAIDAIENRYVVTADIPGAFLQTDMPEDEDPIYIKFTGSMVTLLEKIDPELYARCTVTTRKGRKILYAKANKAIYGTLKAALLFWKKLKGQLAAWDFVENKYDQCTMNKMIKGKQLTVVWHVDDLKISHEDEEVVNELLTDLDLTFGGESGLTTTTGKVHEYLGMTLDYSIPEMIQLTQFDYLQDIIATLPENLQTNRTFATPAGDNLFTVNHDATKLSKADGEVFHKYVAKLLFATKRARPDIQTAISFLCTRVREPDTDDQKKLIRVLAYIRDTIFLPLTIGWDGTGNVYWYVDASFAVHDNMRSHTGAVMTLGKGAALSMSTKQKINTKSSTEAELVGVDDSLPFNIWCKYFLQEQGYHANECIENTEKANKLKYVGHKNILYQDNTSSIKLESNGKASSTKRTRHINIRYFMITDKLKRGEISTITHCPTEDMLADILTKPLQGSLFRKLRNAIMGCNDAEYLKYKLKYEEDRRNSDTVERK